MTLDEIMAAYGPRFNKTERMLLAINKVKPEDAKKCVRFSASEIVELSQVKCGHSIANRYPPRFRGSEVAMLHSMGITPDMVHAEWERLKIIRTILGTKELINRRKPARLVGTGRDGILLQDMSSPDTPHRCVYKFASNIEHEYLILKRINNRHGEALEHIVRLMGEHIPNVAFGVQAINGPSLQEYVETGASGQSTTSAFDIGKDVMDGLIKMRQAGVWYHRDIRPHNILIDSKSKSATIIDFGCATTDKHSRQGDRDRHHRFGGWNDLVSLGQLMYFVATKSHIFDRSRSQSLTLSDQSEMINDYRNEVYTDPTGRLLQGHLKQVNEDIEDPRLKTVIKVCLQAKNYHYTNINRLFNKLSLDPCGER